MLVATVGAIVILKCFDKLIVSVTVQEEHPWFSLGAKVVHGSFDITNILNYFDISKVYDNEVLWQTYCVGHGTGRTSLV